MKYLKEKPKGRIPKEVLQQKIKDFFIQSGIEIIDSTVNEEGCDIFYVLLEGKELAITLFIKTIGNAYLTNNRDVERIQVPCLNTISATTRKSLFLLCGLITIDGRDILVCWSPNDFSYHKTTRSAYICDNNIIEGFERGYFRTIDHNIDVYICDKFHLDKVITSYYNDTYLEGLECH